MLASFRNKIRNKYYVGEDPRIIFTFSACQKYLQGAKIVTTNPCLDSDGYLFFRCQYTLARFSICSVIIACTVDCKILLEFETQQPCIVQICNVPKSGTTRQKYKLSSHKCIIIIYLCVEIYTLHTAN